MEVNIQPLSAALVDKTHAVHTNSTSSITVTHIAADIIDMMFSSSTNLTTTVLGASIVSCSDEYFAAASNLLTPTPPIRRPGVFVHTGAWYDGWETRRHNPKEFDWVVIKLGCVAQIDAVEVDTSYFNGNEAPMAGLDGVAFSSDEDDSAVAQEGYDGWTEILPPQKCGPSRRQAWRVSGPGVQGKQFTHLRLKQYPDGGIARLRVYGTVVPPSLPISVTSGKEERPREDLASALNGGVAIECSDQHFGGKNYLLLPGRGKDMGDGWETARSRVKGHTDWVIVRLGLKGRKIEQVIVDTKDFRGNFPRAVTVEGWAMEGAKAALGTEADPKHDERGWTALVQGEQPCQADTEHVFEGEQLVASELPEGHVWTHVKMTITPDGGVKRLRILGKRA
ncbi:allantoicase [Cladophialophora bantiana CBS 173.52]|uniref:allantoicase n=1 Tax=Cladophialophora bantiana (strain ATCC 10958 / CBS 173.52 / CDC B-1940 / NIH 8579) TaxID=1442370 RepID=A0A0D2IAY7_CLAB1|nr:allantoicase [Cladophialophora bantiana CBS 173.52]KIW93954.1 allantoicase [Cladophialophora bantiana CBS 173.52]